MTRTPNDAFLDLSSDLTGASVFRLQSTGLTDSYVALLTERLGTTAFAALLAAHAAARSAAAENAADVPRQLRHHILSDARLGPAARSLLKLWYVGVWHAMTTDWHSAHGGAIDDVDCVPTPAAYTEGLLWPSIGANPAGVKPHGYAMWANAPRIPDPRQEL